MKDLFYHGNKLTHLPAKIFPWDDMRFNPQDDFDLHWIRDRVIDDGIPLAVELEPGDATNYKLILCADPMDPDYVWVIYGQLERAIKLPIHPSYNHYDFESLTSNEWSRELFAWWFTLVFGDENDVDGLKIVPS